MPWMTAGGKLFSMFPLRSCPWRDSNALVHLAGEMSADPAV